MTISLIKRLENHARLRPTEWISGQTYEDLARDLGYKSSNCGRRLRELAVAGILERREVRGHVEYKWRGENNPQKEATDRIYTSPLITLNSAYKPPQPQETPSVAGTARLFT